MGAGAGCRHPEFAKHTRIAKASLIETQNHLADGVDRKLWSKERAQDNRKLADRAIGACVRLLAHLESTDAPGTNGPRKARRERHSQGGKVRPRSTHHPTPGPLYNPPVHRFFAPGLDP